jgi:hypothetical protein
MTGKLGVTLSLSNGVLMHLKEWNYGLRGWTVALYPTWNYRTGPCKRDQRCANQIYSGFGEAF